MNPTPSPEPYPPLPITTQITSQRQTHASWGDRLIHPVSARNLFAAPCSKLARQFGCVALPASWLHTACTVTFGIAAGMWLAVEVASAGEYYLRGGIGLTRSDASSFIDIDCKSEVPAALYGCGSRDGVPRQSAGDFGAIPVIEAGLGYKNGATRFEFLLEYRPQFEFEGRANFLPPDRRQSVMAELSSISGMLAGFVDFSGPELPDSLPITPYIGAGIGVARTKIGETSMIFPTTTTIVPGEIRSGLAWMLTAGIAVPLSEKMILDLGWRYSDLGEVHTGADRGRVVWHDGSRDPLPLDLAPTRTRLKGHGLRLSLRYAFPKE